MNCDGEIMKGDSIFGIEPERLKKLAALGLKQDESGQFDASAPTASGDLFVEKSGDWIGPYKLVRILGEGGMGIVYLAEQRRPIRRQVALKLVKPGMDSKRVVARFEAEQQAMAVMSHPHVARVYDAGLTGGGRPYFVMEYVEGVPITDHCDRHKLTIEKRLDVFLRVCEAVQHAHQKGIIHRDLKPSNILVSDKDNQAVPKVIDFGIAKALAQPLTQRTLYTEQGQFVGTPEYMSPEQAEPTAQGIDTRTDIYSLGVILYELLAGVLPFDPETLRERGPEHMRRVISEEAPKIPSTRLSTTSKAESGKVAASRHTDVRTLAQRLHGDLDWITLKAMEKDPDRRYASVHALAEDIRRHLNHEPVSAGSPSFLYRLRKFIRRRRTYVIAASCAVALILLAMLSVTLYRQGLANRNRLVQERRTFASQRAEAALATAEVRYAEGQYEQALAQVEASLNHVPDQLHARLLKAHILADTGRRDEALTILGELETEHPDDGTVYEMLAVLYVEQGDEERVTKYRQLAEAFPPKTAEAFIIRALTAENLYAMSELLSRALELDRHHYQARRMRALTYATLRDYDKMERDAETMIFVQPQNPSGHALRAIAFRHLGRTAEALQSHDRAIVLADANDPELVEFYDQRRETYFCSDHYEQALTDARECVGRQPDEIRYRLGLFGALVALGRYDQADEQYDLSAETILRFPCWLAQYVSHIVESGRASVRPAPEDSSSTARLLRCICRRHDELSTKARRLAINAAAADFSPDSRSLVYARFNPDTMWERQTVLAHPEKPGSKGIEIIDDLETATVRSLVSFGHYPRWSPDGRFIAFVKTPYFFRHIWSEHIHIVPAAGGEPQYLCQGVLLGWSRDSSYIYYYRPHDMFVYKRAFDDPNAEPERIIHSPSYFPAISPDESRIAYQHRGHLIIKDLGTLKTLVSWRLPILPLYYWASWRLPTRPDFEPIPIEWSPSGQELSLGSEWADFGLWIYDLSTQTASRVLRGAVLSARWSADGRSMAIVTGNPGWEIWHVHVDPNSPTVVSLGPSLTRQEHCRQMLEELEDELAMFPPGLHRWMRGRTQAFCCAGLGQPAGVAGGLDQWLQSLPEGPAVPPPTYWQMAGSLLDWYCPETDHPQSILALAEDLAELAPHVWSGQVLLGMANYRVGQYEQALAHLEQAERLRRKNDGELHPNHVAIIAMTLHCLGRDQEATITMELLRAMFQETGRHDDFQPLVAAEKIFAGGSERLVAVWEHIEEGNLNEALGLLTEIRGSSTTREAEAVASMASAGQQLALRFAQRGQQYEQRGEHGNAQKDAESTLLAAP